MAFIDTPCVGVCSTVYGDDVCRGCKRYYDEVIDWNGFNDEQRKVIYDRLNQQAEEVVAQFLTIEAPERLAAALDAQSIRYRPDHSPAAWVLQWLRFSRTALPWEMLGIALLPPYQSYSPLTLFTTLDQALYEHATSLQEDEGKNQDR